MILTGNEIAAQRRRGAITLEPFNESQLNPNSYDLRLGDDLISYKDRILDPKKNNRYSISKIPPIGQQLKKLEFYLASTLEKVGSTEFVPILHAKSGIARLGLFVHITADLIDIGSVGNLTLQLHPTIGIEVKPQMLIAQVSFWKPTGDIELYNGKYQGSVGPQASKIHLGEQNS